MRPVTKLKPGDSVTLLDGTTHEIQATYEPHRSAKDPLSANIDNYCSYCEKPIKDEASAIEHIQARSLPQYAHLEFAWSNFLLACSRCNGTDNKGTKDVIFKNVHLPHLNNTMLSVEYGQGGFVQVHSDLAIGSSEYQKAKALVDLVGLDKCPGKFGDNRWQRRFEAWEIAVKYEQKYVQQETTAEIIIDLARPRGFFSVWFTIFEKHPEVRVALIQNFAGTTRACFDPQNNYNPIPRNNPNI